MDTHFGTSVRRSAPLATPTGWGDPTSQTSTRGHALGLRWQKSKKSKAMGPWGNTTRLHCKKPGQTALVGPLNSPERTFWRKALGMSTCVWKRGAPCQSRAVSPSWGADSFSGSSSSMIPLVLGACHCATSRMSILLLLGCAFFSDRGPTSMVGRAFFKSLSSDSERQYERIRQSVRWGERGGEE